MFPNLDSQFSVEWRRISVWIWVFSRVIRFLSFLFRCICHSLRACQVRRTMFVGIVVCVSLCFLFGMLCLMASCITLVSVSTPSICDGEVGLAIFRSFSISPWNCAQWARLYFKISRGFLVCGARAIFSSTGRWSELSSFIVVSLTVNGRF